MSGLNLRGRVVALLVVAAALFVCAPNPVYAVTSGNGDNGSDNDGPVYLILSLAEEFATPELDNLPDFPEATTVEMAQFIFDYATSPETGDPEYFLGDQSNEGGEGPLTVQAILDSIFVTEAVLDAPEEEQFAEADGDLYPHDPDDDQNPLFEFALQIDSDDGTLAIDVCLTVQIDIMPRSKKNFVWIDNYWGVLPVVLWGSDEFSVSEIEKGTVRLGGVRPLYCRVILWDFNCDGNKDLLAFWGVRCLVKAGALDKYTTELSLTADLTDGGCIKGTDSVKPKWRRKKKKKKCW